MFLVQQITAAPLQSQNIVLPDTTIVSIELYFRPMQQGWFLNTIIYGSFILNGLRITNSPNMLFQFQNQIPFGLACYSTANREPSLQQDFSSGNSSLYVLSQAECKEYFNFLKTGVL